mmetsp:Transcript_14838/g.28226  ORF Transcript_14838/g.28226 Transcript_14838/m.28226 type:complete len:236 (-) Transcript_14838:638-1345(-)
MASSTVILPCLTMFITSILCASVSFAAAAFRSGCDARFISSISSFLLLLLIRLLGLVMFSLTASLSCILITPYASSVRARLTASSAESAIRDKNSLRASVRATNTRRPERDFFPACLAAYWHNAKRSEISPCQNPNRPVFLAGAGVAGGLAFAESRWGSGAGTTASRAWLPTVMDAERSRDVEREGSWLGLSVLLAMVLLFITDAELPWLWLWLSTIVLGRLRVVSSYRVSTSST